MCLKMFGTKNTTLKNPVSAIFKQLIMTSFDFLDSMLRPFIDKQLKFHSELNKNNLDIEEDKSEIKPTFEKIEEKQSNSPIFSKHEDDRNNIQNSPINKEIDYRIKLNSNVINIGHDDKCKYNILLLF